MELKSVLVEIMPLIVNQIYNRQKYDSDKEFLDECYTLVENDIDLNIDSRFVYLLSYSMMNKNEIYFEYFKDGNMKLLNCIKKIIDTDRKMTENIKNKNHRIHYRVYKDNVYLEDDENTLRKHFFLHVVNVLDKKTFILNYLLDKLYNIENKSKPTIKQLIIIERTKKIISFLVEHINRCSSSST